MERYGLPYQGSKNQIAKQIIDFLPPARNFYDLFAGGCAITHAAIESGKYKCIFFNDTNGAITQLFLDAVHGKYQDEKRWISREDFFRLKDSDPYVRYCWSFSNNGKDYLYGRHLESWKKAYHFAKVLGDWSLFSEMGLEFSCLEKENLRAAIVKRHEECEEKYKRWLLTRAEQSDSVPLGTGKEMCFNSLDRIQGFESLERLQSLERLERLERLNLSYDEVQILPDSVVYCDIPYKDTTGYVDKKVTNKDFDHEKFYKWAESQTQLVFISEYKMP